MTTTPAKPGPGKQASNEAIPLYRIRDWDRVFEKSQNRKVRKLSWVSVPNRHDGAGFRRLMAFQRGVEAYGAWLLIVEVASRLPTRGTLANENGALDCEDLSAKTGAPAAVFRRAIALLQKPGIAWLEKVQTRASLPAGARAPPAGARSLPEDGAALVGRYDLQDRTGQDITGQNRTEILRPTRSGNSKHINSDPIAATSAGSGRVSNSGDSGPDRRGSDARWRNEFVAKLVAALGMASDPTRALSQRRPLLAVARRFVQQEGRDGVLELLISMAREKAAAGLDNPAAAWQKAVDEQYPDTSRHADVGGSQEGDLVR